MIDPLTLDQMRVLIAVAETGSFSAAARKLGRVQSAISQAVQAMEQALRLTLFDRSREDPVLTDAGAGDARRRPRGAGAGADHAGARARHPRRPRARADARGRRGVSHAGADEQPAGAAQRLPHPAGDAVHRGARRRARDADDRRGADGDLSDRRRPAAGGSRRVPGARRAGAGRRRPIIRWRSSAARRGARISKRTFNSC